MKSSLFKIAFFTCGLLFNSLSFAAEMRIISAGSGVTELLYALDAQDKIVAVDSTSRSYVEGSEIPQVGYHRQLSTEGLLALSPTHLIGSQEMGPKSTLQQVAAAKVEVITVPAGNDVDDLLARVDTVAKMTAKQAQAKQLKQQIRDSIRAINEKTLPTQPKVLFLMLNQGRALSVGGDNTSIDHIISLAGGQNPAKKLISSYKPLEMESILNMQPDYLLVSEYSLKKLGGIEMLLKDYPLLSATPAAENNRIITIPGTALIGGLGLKSIELAKKLNHIFATSETTKSPL